MAATKRKSADEGTGKPSGETGGKVRRTQNGKAAAEVKGKWYDKKKQDALKKKPGKPFAGSKTSPSVSKGKEGKDKGVKPGPPAAVLKKKGSALLVQQVVSIWEDLRPRQASAEVKQKLVADILKAGKGKMKELAVKSKSSRVIQALLKNGTKEQKQKIWNECKEHIVEISMSVYGNHVIRKFISIASKEQLAAILRACKGTIVKLFKHPCGSAVVADLYEELSAADRNAIVAEFYSRETALLGAKSSTATLKSLVDAWPTMDGTERRSTMQRLIMALQPIIEKAYVDPPAIHRLVSEYMRLAPADMLQDTVDSLIGEATLRMVHTHEGCRVGCMVAAYSTPKQRKKLVKSMKGHVLKMCLDEFAYIVLIKTLASIDDTELVRKSVVPEIQSNLEEILASQNGIKVVLSLVSAEVKHLPPHARELLNTPERTVTVAIADAEQKEGDKDGEGDAMDDDAEEKEKPTETKILGLSKKEPLVRRRELLSSGKASLSASLVEHCVQHAAELLGTQHGGELVECLCCGGDVGSWLWESSEDSITAVHAAVAAAINGEPVAHSEVALESKDEKETGNKKSKDSNMESGDDGENEEGDESEEDADMTEAKDAQQKPAGEQVTEGEKDLTENFFATRALKRMVACAHGPSGESFLKKLWEAAIKGKVAALKGTHICKVIAALAVCSVPDVAKGVRKELSEALAGEDVDQFLEKFTKPPKEKVPKEKVPKEKAPKEKPQAPKKAQAPKEKASSKGKGAKSGR